MEVLINEFYQAEKRKIISEGTFGFAAVVVFAYFSSIQK
jgi:hypothetical protein